MDFSFRPCKTLKWCSGRKLSNKDRISGLPDDILVLVLSLLTMKEAGQTSLLSKRWRHVWAHVPLLNFDGSKILDELADDYVSVVVERNNYLHWVDQVLSLHKASSVDEFRVRYYLCDTSSENINKWLGFAVEKRIKRLELDFGYYDGTGGFSLYHFPNLYFSSSLTSFQLAFVNVVGEVLESLLYNCKALEVLSVISSDVLVDLKIVGPSLKSLRITQCYELINLEIFAPNLVYMDYNGIECMPFKSTPKLAELVIGGNDKPHLMMSLINHQIELLTLNIHSIQAFSEAFPNCTRLTMMDIHFTPACDKDLVGISSLIKACPLLQKLVLQLDLFKFRRYKKKWKSRGEPWCHYHLKIVEIVGFAGSMLKFARYLVKNIVSLEKVIIDTQPAFCVRIPGEPEVGETITKALKKAELLHAHLKSGTELQIR